MLNDQVILDARDPRIGHADVQCSANSGLVARLRAAGVPPDDRVRALAVAAAAGDVVPAWVARSARPCPWCTLVATTHGWAAAA